MKISSFQKGINAECYIGEFLTKKGYRILKQRFKTPFGEIDLIAAQHKKLTFVEVKCRPHYSLGVYALGIQQKNRIKRTAEYFLTIHEDMIWQTIQFDLLVFCSQAKIFHLENIILD